MTPQPDLAALHTWLRDAPPPPRDAGSLRLICLRRGGRFGLDALKWVSTPDGKARRLRGANASVVTPGTIRVGDSVAVVARTAAAVEPMESLAG
jgi:MOSC domain-containing protein YiiM